jgi:DnaJ-class molecular chaperone
MKIEFDEKCKSCNGTGLYQGMGERDGFAVVCNQCKGTGKYHFEHNYDEFEGRQERPNISTVVECNPGICLGGNLNFGGMSYKEWLSGKQFEIGMEMREYVCPCWWYQTADYKKKPEWKECGFGSFSACKNFPDKKACWDKWDKEFGNK